MNQRIILCYLLSLLAGYFLWTQQEKGTFQNINHSWTKWISQSLGLKASQSKVQLIRFDNEQEDGLTAWPPSSADYALATRHLAHFGVETIGYTSVIAPTADDLFGESLALSLDKIPRIIFGAILENDPAESGMVDNALPLVMEPFQTVEGTIDKIPYFTGIDSFPTSVVRQKGSVAFQRIDPGVQWVQEKSKIRIPLLARHGNHVIPSITLRLAMAGVGASNSSTIVNVGKHIQFSDIKIPIDNKGTMLVDTYQFPSLVTLLSSNLDPETTEYLIGEDTPEDLNNLSTKPVAILALDDNRSKIIPTKQTKVSPGTLVALGVSTILSYQNNSIPLVVRQWASWVIAGLFCLILPWLFGRNALLFSLLFLLLYLGCAIFAYTFYQLRLPVIAPIICAGVSFLLCLLIPDNRIRIRQ